MGGGGGGGGVKGVFFLSVGGVFFHFWGWVWGIQFLFLMGGGGVFAFFKLTGSGGITIVF